MGRSRLDPVPNGGAARSDEVWATLDPSHNFVELPQLVADDRRVSSVDLTLEIAGVGASGGGLWADNGRQSVRQLSKDRWRLEVRAAPREDAPVRAVPLGPDERHRMTDATGLGTVVLATARGLSVDTDGVGPPAPGRAQKTAEAVCNG